MENNHYIEWIEVVSRNTRQKIFLKPEQKPEAEFEVDGELQARCYCNIHGLWKSN